MPRGGRRPGAGAKPGNLNALRHGKRSPRVQRLRAEMAALRHIPEGQRLLETLARHETHRRRRDKHAAALVLRRLLQGHVPEQQIVRLAALIATPAGKRDSLRPQHNPAASGEAANHQSPATNDQRSIPGQSSIGQFHQPAPGLVPTPSGRANVKRPEW